MDRNAKMEQSQGSLFGGHIGKRDIIQGCVTASGEVVSTEIGVTRDCIGIVMLVMLAAGSVDDIIANVGRGGARYPKRLKGSLRDGSQ